MNTGGYRWFTEEEIASWPPEHKMCRGCREVLPFSRFHKQKNVLLGRANKCKECRKPDSRRQYSEETIEHRMFYRCKQRAKDKGVPFDLSKDDFVVPKFCPALGIPLSLDGDRDNSPSVDRFIPELGYVKGNIQIISYRANVIKNNACADELERIARWMRGLE